MLFDILNGAPGVGHPLKNPHGSAHNRTEERDGPLILKAAGTKGLHIIFIQKLVDIYDAAGPFVEDDHKQGISGLFGIERRHIVFFQCPLGLFQSKFPCIEDPEKNISLSGMLFAGQKLVSVAFRYIGL